MGPFLPGPGPLAPAPHSDKLAPSNTVYNQSVSGALSFSGAAPLFAMNRSLTGALSFTGLLNRAPTRLLLASLTPTGLLIRSASRKLLASITPTGALSGTKILVRTLVGAAFTPHGVVTGVKVLARTLSAAALSFIGGANLYPDPGLYPSPDLYPYGGAILFQLNRTLSAVLAPVGSLGTHASVSRIFTAILQPSAAFIHTSSRKLVAALSWVGSFNAQQSAHVFFKALFGALSAAGSLSTILDPGTLDEGGGGYGVPMPDSFFQRYQPTLRRQKMKV